MSTRMRINSIVLSTDGGEVRHDFRGPLTVLTGPVGVGKSTLFELVKHAVGGNARIAPVARDHVTSIQVDIEIGDQNLRLTRSLSGDTSHVNVYDIREDIAIGKLPVSPGRNNSEISDTISSKLMESMDLPIDVYSTTRSRSTRITFNNVWTFIYAEQREIDRSIARNNDSYAEPARKTTFELLFGLTDYHVLDLRKQQLAAEEERSKALAEEELVLDFLQDSRTKTRADTERIVEEQRARRRAAEEHMERLQKEADVVRGEVGVVRDLVLQAREDVSRLQHDQRLVELEQQDRRRIIGRLESRIAEVERADQAEALLGPIKFVVCPRCAQSIRDRVHDEGTCELCLQPDPEPDPMLVRRSADELSRISSQIEELQILLSSSEDQSSVLDRAITSARENLRELERALDERTNYFVAPRLEQFMDSASELARSEAILNAMEDVLRQWDRAQDLQLARASAERKVASISEKLLVAERALEETRNDLLTALSTDYQEMVNRLGVPTVTSAYVDSRNYLPFANTDRFDRISTGGITTALVTAYWLTVLATALRERRTRYPTMLIIDTPRKSIGQANAHLADELYRQLDILAEANGDRMQVIVADNDIPVDISKRWQDLRFDYENPTIPTVRHPGPANVDTLDMDT